MGRKKTYDRDTLIEKAMNLFRDHGFAGTSSEMLVNTLGVSRFSLYAEFESKQKLFETALERYDQTNIERNFAPLESPEAGTKEIQSLFEFFSLAVDGAAAGRGCLLCNTAVEFGPDDPSGTGFVQKYFKRISSAFYNALKNAKKDEKLKPNVSLQKEADFFTSSVLGLFVMIRAKAEPRIVKNAASMAVEHLNALRN